MKKIVFNLVLLSSLLCCTNLNAQWQNGLWIEKQAYNWYFGVEAGLNFNTTPPEAVTDGINLSPSFVAEGTGAISDENGELLFYTNGITIYNKNHEIMDNGDGLLGSISATQSGLIIPAPNNPNIYYVFCNGSFESPNGLTYSEVDMSLDGGLGAVTSNKNIQLTLTTSEKLTAVYHTDGVKVWVICHAGGFNNPNNEFHAYLVTDEGIDTTPVISSTGLIMNIDIGQLKVSPDGTKLAMATGLFGNFLSCQLFDFDANTGQVSNPINLSSAISTTGWGIEFSPNSRFLYVLDWGMTQVESTLQQFDLSAGDGAAILISSTIINEPYNSNHLGLQAGPDGKIYIAQQGGNTLSVINYPNNLALAAGFEDGAVDLADGISGNYLTNFIQSYFESGILYEGGDCSGEGVAFTTLRIPGIESIVWDFGDPNSGSENESTDLEPIHAFSSGGTYTVTAIITSNGAQQTATTQIIILPVPDAVIPSLNDLTKCAEASGNATFDLTNLDNTILSGQNVDEFIVSYYTSLENIENGNAIDTTNGFVTEGQTIYAVVTNITTGCSTSLKFDVFVLPLPSLPEVTSFEGCSPFDLFAIVGEPEEGTSFIFFINEEDAVSNSNEITNAYGYLVEDNIGTIYVRAVSDEGCVQIGELDLTPGNCFIPKGISPNNDGLNDSFDLSRFEVSQLKIFNRYGLEVYSRNNYKNEWTGQASNGNDLPTGTYYYAIEQNSQKNLTGWVYLNREEN